MSKSWGLLETANSKVMNHLSYLSGGCYARDRRSGGSLSQLWPQVFENTRFLRTTFPR